MEGTQKQETASGTLDRLAERGQDALKRISAEVDKNPRMHEAKERIEKVGRSTLHQLNIALEDEVADLRKQVDRLEKRLAKLEKDAGAKS
jgi:ubiquinone biosynthesis protein UbiJ